MSDVSPIPRPFAGAGEIAPIVALWERCGLVVPHNDARADLVALVLSHHGRLFVAEAADGAIIGAVIASHDGHRGWIYKLAVDPTARKRGLGERLVRAAERWIAEQGVVKTMLLIRDTNVAVRGFYERLGYAAEPRLVMSRWLRADPRRPDPSDVEVVITHLEMTRPPTAPPHHPPRSGLALLRLERPSIAFYRHLYEGVGASWGWHDRTLMADDALAAIIRNPKVAVTVLYVGGEPGGYFELDGRMPGEVELAYFGLFPAAIGQGLGPYLLDHAIRAAWLGIPAERRGGGVAPPSRVWVHTCNLDHPKALALYQRAGFKPFRQDVEIKTVPPHHARRRDRAARREPEAS